MLIRSAYRLSDPVCCSRVACAFPAIVLSAEATGAMAAVRLRAAKAARMRFFIGTLHLFAGQDVRLRWMDRCASATVLVRWSIWHGVMSAIHISGLDSM